MKLTFLQKIYMKRVELIVGILFVAVTVFAVVFGMNLTDSPAVFAEGTTINAWTVSGLTAAETAEQLNELTENYSFTLYVSGTSYTLTGEQLNLTCNADEETIQALLDQQQADESIISFSVEDLFSADVDTLLSLLLADYPATEIVDASTEIVSNDGDDTSAVEEVINESDDSEDTDEAEENEDAISTAPVDAYLLYDEDTETYIIVPDVEGQNVDCEAIAAAALAAIVNLKVSLTLNLSDYRQQASVTADDVDLLAAQEQLNELLDLELTYIFTPASGDSSTVTLTRSELAAIYYYDDDFTVQVNEDSVAELVALWADTYSYSNSSAQFKTTGGSYVTISVSEAGQTVDSVSLYADLYECLSTATSGERSAPYAESGDSVANLWGGNYVEIDLTNQHLWCYNNGELVVSCDIVSGCAANGTTTPTGCFTIFAKNTDRYLQGSNVDGTTYKSWVYYFMPFSGGIGIHDATWRSSFGGTIYLYSGSHGCVGVTKANAETIYNNVEIGTHVIVYGGLTASDLTERDQSLSLSADSTSLDVGGTTTLSVSGAKGKLTYSSSDEKVATVDDEGNITAIGEGTAQITVTAAKNGVYLKTSKSITITVAHSWTAVYETQTVEGTVTQTVTETEAYDETVTLYTCSCGETFDTSDDAQAHLSTHVIETTETNEDGDEIVVTSSDSSYSISTDTETIHHDAVTKEVEVSAEEEVEVLTGYICSGCGKTKSAS